MIPSAEVSISLQSAMGEYFDGERREMFFIFTGSLVLAGLAAWLWMSSRSGFALGFVVTVLLAATLLSATAASLLIRDKALSSALGQGFGSPQQALVVSAERSRIQAVVSKYRYYRYGAAAFVALSLLGLLLTHRNWVHGAAAGLLMLVVAQILIDHFSEQRARIYLAQLSAIAVASSDGIISSSE